MSGYPSKFGKYLLLERVNVGGMAEVFKAKTFGVAGFERILAIKRILPSLVEDDEFIRMFIDEARIAVQLNHPNIVQIYELGKHGEHYYIAMEYLASRDLRGILDRLRLHGQLMPIPQAAFVTSKVCEGLHYAHRKGDPAGHPMNIIHRDVSPQNVLVSYEGEIKIIDFGIAKAANRASKTQAGVLKGKFGYMSPEQVRGLPIDRRSDIFAVGVLLYEMLTGERLFVGESDFSTLERVRNAEVPPPTTFNKKISPELEAIVLKSLAREVEDRYQWASELADDLQRFLIEDRSIYSPKRLAAYMKEAYAEEISREQSKQEEFLQLSPDDLKPRPTGAIEAPAPTAPAAKPDVPSDGIEWDDADDFEDSKTFVIEASEAGQMLEQAEAKHAAPGGDTDENLGKGKTGQNPRVAPQTNDAFLSDPSLYGDEMIEDEDDDAKTMVSFANPFDENPNGDVPQTDPAQSIDEDKTVVRPDGPSAVAASAAAAAAAPPATPQAPVQDDIVRPNAPTAMMPAVDPASFSADDPAPDDETLAGAPLPTPGAPLPTPGAPPPPMGQASTPQAPAPATPSDNVVALSDNAVVAPAPNAKPKAAFSKGCLAAVIAGVGIGFALLVTAVVGIVYALNSGGDPVVLDIAGVETEESFQLFIDGDEVKTKLPATIEVAADDKHKVRITTASGETWNGVVPALPGATRFALAPKIGAGDAASDDGEKDSAEDGDDPKNAKDDADKVATKDDPTPKKDAPAATKADDDKGGDDDKAEGKVATATDAADGKKEKKDTDAPDDAKADVQAPTAEADAASAKTVSLGALGEDDERWRVSFAAVHREERQAIRGASVFLGDDLIGFTPFERDFPSSMEKVKLRVKADGFKTKKLTIERDGRDVVGPATLLLKATGDESDDDDKGEEDDDEGDDDKGDEDSKDDDDDTGEDDAKDDDSEPTGDDKKVAEKGDEDADTNNDDGDKKAKADTASDDGDKATAQNSKAKKDSTSPASSKKDSSKPAKAQPTKTSSKSSNAKSSSSNSSKSGRGGSRRGAKEKSSSSGRKSEAAKGTSKLSLGSRPRGMKVFVDKKARGQTPLMASRAFPVGVGSHFMMIVDPKTNKKYKFRFKITKAGKPVKIIFDAKANKVTAKGPVSVTTVK